MVVTGLVATLLLLPPLLGACLGLLDLAGGGVESPETLGFRGWKAAFVTIGWSLAIGAIASVIGLGPGRRLAVTTRPLEAIAWTVPLLLAPALFFDAWWLEVGPDGVIGSIAAERGLVPRLREGVLGLGLLGTAVPLAVWAHAGGHDPSVVVLRRLDAPRGGGRWSAWWRLDAGEVGRVAALVALVIAGLTVPFDLAQIGSWGFELRTLDTRGASPGTLWRAGGWAVAIAVVAAVVVARRLGRIGRRGRTRSLSVGGVAGIVIGGLIVAVPIALLTRRAFEADLGVAWRLHGAAAWNTAMVGGVGIVLGAAMALFVAMARLGGVRGAVVATSVIALAAVVAFLPATLVAVGAANLWNHDATTFVYDGPLAMMLAVGGRVALVPSVLGHLAVPRVGRAAGGPLALDAPRRSSDAWRACRPVLVAAAMVGGLAGGVLAVAEIPVTARLQPPGFPMISTALLNAMHYQYVDSVLPVAVPFVLAAVPVAIVAAVMLRRARLGGSATVCLLSAIVMLSISPGCDRPVDDTASIDEPAPVPHDVLFGRPGNLSGRFEYPRALAIDASRNRLFVVDKSARVQRFSLNGDFEMAWTMPRFENGKPTGISIAPDGRVVVADTHEHRITIFSPDGDLLETHGRHGVEPGEFIYPTDVAAGPDGRWFVSEYGGNDRVQIFDADWTPIGVIGFAGEEDDGTRPALSRPQSIAWHAERGELFIVDAIHHRIVVVDADGGLRRVLGGPGLEPGRFSYPYGVAVDADGSVVVVEFGSNRVQRIDPEQGTCLSVVGGTGVEPGQLRYPWAVDVEDGIMAVLDSGNARVMVGPTPATGVGLPHGRPSEGSAGGR